MLFNIVVLLWTEASVALSYTEFAARQNVKNLFKIAGLDVTIQWTCFLTSVKL